MVRVVCVGVAVVCSLGRAWSGFQDAAQQAPAQAGCRSRPRPVPDETAQALVGRLDLERYKATIKGLTQFGDRRQGTDRNRAAVDWIEAQLKSYGCPTERIKYEYVTPQRGRGAPGRGGRGSRDRAGNKRPGQGGSTIFGTTRPHRREHRPDGAARREAPRAQLAAGAPTVRARRSTAPRSARRRPGEMYIIGAHMDGIGWGEAANDDGSGTAIVMELARDLQQPGRADRPHRFASSLWNNEETGLNGARAYVAQRAGAAGQGESGRIRQVSRSRNGSA